ncbi:hypothetical protein Ahy_B03g066266 isoform B [Arachis hypogaea]|nr:hypothetical protein Ahy_B03g066266 isoform B [Arachis hypogaea]
MPFGECTITLQDVAYQLGLPVDGHYVSGCLTDFHVYIQGKGEICCYVSNAECPVCSWR